MTDPRQAAKAAALKRKFEEAMAISENVADLKPSDERFIGKVVFYDKQKGYGFIVTEEDAEKDQGGMKIFVHHSQIVGAGFRRLKEDQEVSYKRGENQGKLWAVDVKNPDGSQILHDEDKKKFELQEKRKKEEKKAKWKNFFDLPQYSLKAYMESMPRSVENQDASVEFETMPQLGYMFALFHGHWGDKRVGNECAKHLKEKVPKMVKEAYVESEDVGHALEKGLRDADKEFFEIAIRKQIPDGVEGTVALFVHSVSKKTNRPCIQLWLGHVGQMAPLLCNYEGRPLRIGNLHSVKKDRLALTKANYEVDEAKNEISTSYAEGDSRQFETLTLKASRIFCGRPFRKTFEASSGITGNPEVKLVKEWSVVVGEELFMIIATPQIYEVMSEDEVIDTALDAWVAEGRFEDGSEAAAKLIVRTALGKGAEYSPESMSCLVIQFWWQEKPLQKLIQKRKEAKERGEGKKSAEGDNFDMFG